MFQPATQVQKKLKVLVYGESGTGKTTLALTFPRPAVIDTEGGTELYGGRSDFHVFRTKSYKDILSALAYIEQDGGQNFDTLVLDPITVIYQVLQEAAAKQNGMIDIQGWGKIRGFMNRLYTRLANLPVHVVVVARQKDNIKRQGDKLIQAGVRADADKQIEYMFDFVLRMHHSDDGTARKAQVIKDRSGSGVTHIDNPTFADFQQVAGMIAEGETVEHVSETAAAESDAALFDDNRQAQPAPTQNTGGDAQHWTITDAYAFQEHCAHRGLSLSEAFAAMNVGALSEYTGTKQDAEDAITAYIDKNTSPKA
jgi:hypothetical protein